MQLVAAVLFFGAFSFPPVWFTAILGRSLRLSKLNQFSDHLSRFCTARMMRWIPGMSWNPSEAFAKFEELRTRFPNGLVVVGNHRSHIDTFMILSSVASVRILAKKSLFRIPLLGMAMYALQHIPVGMGEGFAASIKMFTAVKQRLARGDCVFFFPEGSRCKFGHRGVGPFHLSAFVAAREASVPIVPVIFYGTDKLWPKGTLRISGPAKIEMHVLEPVHSRKDQDVQTFCKEVHDKICAKYEEIDFAT